MAPPRDHLFYLVSFEEKLKTSSCAKTRRPRPLIFGMYIPSAREPLPRLFRL